uniref:Uncharacterized protein n=1 Tax=Oedogonium capilliforme TaxID=2831087 RepID=A0A8E8U1S2_9CHLO|nr:hypothetical protein [Oedogonium capilliforme]QWE36193.1 hypothetical protein [Oedogonium capilliforme]
MDVWWCSFKVNEAPDLLKVYSKNVTRSMSEDVSELVALKIVGESYFKWNLTTSYYPTVVFIFKEVSKDLVGIYRRVQIKLRYFKESNEVNSNDVSSLRKQCNDLKNLEYMYGQVRVNFVPPNKVGKTNLFVQDKETAIYLLAILCQIAGVEFNEGCLSLTEGRKKSFITRRTIPLDNYEPVLDSYQTIFKVRLYRVVLLINGLPQPIIIFRNY